MNAAVKGMRISLPATSANLGPGFDAVGLALSLHLTVEAHAAPTFQVYATGRNADICGALEQNLVIETYRDLLHAHHRPVQPLRLHLHNEIPLGMGCGSSAAALLAGVALAVHFGKLPWDDDRIVAEASRREGHPDNVAACWYGGFTLSAESDGRVVSATVPGPAHWEMMLVLQASSLATKTARALLPESYSRADAVFNVQRAALLAAAFTQGRLALLRTATEDRMHQPYRMEACPLLPALLPLRDEPEIAAVTLSGAGPSVLVFLAEGVTALEAEVRLRAAVPPEAEVLSVRVAQGVERSELV